jgi:predicted RNase H-like nuclease (RuvC/YqgF family)
MNTKIGVAILAVACFGLAVALVAIKRQAESQQKDSANTIVDFSNQIAKANIHIEASLQSAQQQITNRDERIADLEARNLVLDQRATSLSNAIAELDTQINLTRAKLAASETNNAFLDSELKQQIAEKAALERKFNDLAQVRAQVRKLRDDLLIARRLEWMREGIDPNKPLKGGQLLMQRSTSAKHAAPAAGSQLYNLNVEVGSDGSVHVIPPPTNAPSH